jgi:hypothetical protein
MSNVRLHGDSGGGRKKRRKTRKNKRRIKKLKTSSMRVCRKTSFRNSCSRKKIKKQRGAASLRENGHEVIEYNGSRIAVYGELEYMKESLGKSLNAIDGDAEKDIIEIAYCVFQIGNVVIKALPFDSLKTCELTKKAYEEGVGVKYLKHIIVRKRERYERVYLFTEFLPIIEKNFDKEKIKNFAEKISKTSLLFHPDFWYQNICVDEEKNLKAIDWDSYMYDMKSNIDNPDSAIRMMMERYNYKFLNTP